MRGSDSADNGNYRKGDCRQMTKQEFKICEAVALGLTHYYMGPRDKREVTATERAEALATIPDLPAGWMQEEQEWMLHKNPKKRLKH